jgi:rhodanese-related sulfurtransferase
MKKLFRGTVSLILRYLAVVLLITSSISSAQEVKSIKPEELKKLIESKADIVVVDNQPKGAYDMEHIPGAVNFPWAMQIKGPVNLPRNKLLILYCACAHEEDSTDVANQLIEFGYNNIKVLEGGWLRWVELGYPIEKK